MDKRWIYILIILIIGVICLFFIVESSTTVGTANVNLDTFTLTMPSDYNIEDSNGGYLEIYNKNTREKLAIKDLGKKNNFSSEMGNKLSALEANENVTLIKNTTITCKNITAQSIYYEKVQGTINRATYFNKYNHSFSIESYNFHDNSTMEKNIIFLMDNLRPDYKQKQS